MRRRCCRALSIVAVGITKREAQGAAEPKRWFCETGAERFAARDEEHRREMTPPSQEKAPTSIATQTCVFFWTSRTA